MAGVEVEFPHISQGWYRAVVFCSEALTMDVARQAIIIRQGALRKLEPHGPEWFTATIKHEDPNNSEEFFLDAQRRVVGDDEHAPDLLKALKANPEKLSDGKFVNGVTYSHCWYIFGSDDPNMDFFNDWLGISQLVAGADPNAVWVDLAELK